jgi:xeroderma pigmentosum group C-complementing protein
VDAESTSTKRGADDEFEMQLAMAIAATAAVAEAESMKSPGTSRSSNPDTLQQDIPDSKRSKKIKGLGNNGNASLRQRLGFSPKREEVGSNGGAVWSRKLGPVIHWAEVYCSGDGTEGRWVHVDAARGIVDGADKIEGAAAACRLPLRYVVAFAGGGAKDVTRRYVTLWFKIDRLRVDQDWWEATLNPLKQLEAAATAEVVTEGRSGLASSSGRSNDRSALEDMEMETKTFTEPLPTNQQAYRTHHLYVIEKWLTKYQTLYPKGPVLGYCAGYPVYPRACVQVLHTPDYWLREGFKVKSGESPVKVVKARPAPKKESDAPDFELEEQEQKEEKMTELYGKWQTNPWQPPCAVDGKVPKNERGQVDVWSEKCIPPGTVHLRLPGLVPLVQKLGIDFAPAMVGFEARRGRAYPVYDGLIICEEFKDLILDANRAQEEERLAKLLKKEEEAAAKRQRHLERTMATRQRLEATYEGNEASTAEPEPEAVRSAADGAEPVESEANIPSKIGKKRTVRQRKSVQSPHIHQFPEEDQTYDEDTGVRTKLCACGFAYYVEDM